MYHVNTFFKSASIFSSCSLVPLNKKNAHHGWLEPWTARRAWRNSFCLTYQNILTIFLHSIHFSYMHHRIYEKLLSEYYIVYMSSCFPNFREIWNSFDTCPFIFILYIWEAAFRIFARYEIHLIHFKTIVFTC